MYGLGFKVLGSELRDPDLGVRIKLQGVLIRVVLTWAIV